MCSPYRIELAGLALLVLAGCNKGPATDLPVRQLGSRAVIDSALTAGLSRSAVSEDPRAALYYDNAAAVNTGRRLFGQYNCSGCHSNGGGGMGPSLMDDEWIYGGRLEQIHQTLVEGRPNGMPSWGGKVPDEQLWQLAAYVRSMSLPATLAAQNGSTPSQAPAPVPREADDHAGWSPPPNTTNDYTTITTGPQ
ncbi:MAG: cytochrome c class [Gammaproteobacteria bacterium]|nr:cytochrome c class [Gammaproteobacteria bacterium]